MSDKVVKSSGIYGEEGSVEVRSEDRVITCNFTNNFIYTGIAFYILYNYGLNRITDSSPLTLYFPPDPANRGQVKLVSKRADDFVNTDSGNINALDTEIKSVSSDPEKDDFNYQDYLNVDISYNTGIDYKIDLNTDKLYDNIDINFNIISDDGSQEDVLYVSYKAKPAGFSGIMKLNSSGESTDFPFSYLMEQEEIPVLGPSSELSANVTSTVVYTQDNREVTLMDYRDKLSSKLCFSVSEEYSDYFETTNDWDTTYITVKNDAPTVENPIDCNLKLTIVQRENDDNTIPIEDNTIAEYDFVVQYNNPPEVVESEPEEPGPDTPEGPTE